MRFRIEDRSMEPSLKPGDYIIANRWAYFFSEPKVGEMVVLKDPVAMNKFLVKRIDRVSNNEFFVVGDNKTFSRDSRSFGSIKRSLIVGKVLVYFGTK